MAEVLSEVDSLQGQLADAMKINSWSGQRKPVS